MNHKLKLVPSLFYLTLLLVGVSCSDDNSTNIGIVTLKPSNTLGDVLVDGNGKTLYVFAKDINGESQCTGGCLGTWPVYHAADLKPGSGINVADFSTITRSDGTEQTTFQGWPLYYYSGDTQPGETNGEGIGNIWFAAKADYSVMMGSRQLVGKDGKNYTSLYVEGTGETQYFVDNHGRALYTFSKDFKNTNKFTASDFSNNGVWPIFYTEIGSLPSTFNADDFDEIDVYGQQQLTYKGNPLYYFGDDTNPGENKGVSVPVPGIWPVASTQTPEALDEPTIKLKNDATLGNVLTDAKGRILYFFARETKGTSACTGGCLNRWPLFYVENLILPTAGTLAEADFGTIGDGVSKQRTYKGRPLYYFSATNDGIVEPAGAKGGDAFGNVWYVAKPDYSLMVASAQLVGLDGKNYTSAYVEGTANTRYFTDAAGRTLYAFANDKKDKNNFTAADFSNDAAWPTFNVTVSHLPTGLSASDFGVTEVHGRSQMTYRGWPLYYFGQDTQRGDNKGVSVPVPGKWPVINGDTGQAPL